MLQPSTLALSICTVKVGIPFGNGVLGPWYMSMSSDEHNVVVDDGDPVSGLLSDP